MINGFNGALVRQQTGPLTPMANVALRSQILHAAYSVQRTVSPSTRLFSKLMSPYLAGPSRLRRLRANIVLACLGRQLLGKLSSPELPPSSAPPPGISARGNGTRLTRSLQIPVTSLQEHASTLSHLAGWPLTFKTDSNHPSDRYRSGWCYCRQRETQ